MYDHINMLSSCFCYILLDLFGFWVCKTHLTLSSLFSALILKEQYFLPSKNHIGRLYRKCHTSSILTPNGKENAQKLAVSLLRQLLSVSFSLLVSLIYLTMSHAPVVSHTEPQSAVRNIMKSVLSLELFFLPACEVWLWLLVFSSCQVDSTRIPSIKPPCIAS